MTYGEGTMTEIRPGVWRLRVMSAGRQRSRTVRTAKRSGKTEARSALGAFRGELAQNSHPETDATVDKLLDDYLDQVRERVRETTHETYVARARQYIRPAIGRLLVSELRSSHLDAFYRKLSRDGYAPATIRVCHAVISGALSQAERWEWIGKSPARLASPPPIQKLREPGLSQDDLQRLLRAAESDDLDLATALALAALTGARRGELCGLQWRDLDTSERTIRIERSWAEGVAGSQHLGPVKTGEARVVPIGLVGLQVIARYQAVLEDRIPGWKPMPEAWLCSYDGGTTPIRGPSMSAFIRSVGKRLTPPVVVHLHQLRHFAATELGRVGVNPRVAADLLGHASTRMTMDVYTDRMGTELRRAVDHLGSIVAPALEP